MARTRKRGGKKQKGGNPVAEVISRVVETAKGLGGKVTDTAKGAGDEAWSGMRRLHTHVGRVFEPVAEDVDKKKRIIKQFGIVPITQDGGRKKKKHTKKYKKKGKKRGGTCRSHKKSKRSKHKKSHKKKGKKRGGTRRRKAGCNTCGCR